MNWQNWKLEDWNDKTVKVRGLVLHFCQIPFMHFGIVLISMLYGNQFLGGLEEIIQCLTLFQTWFRCWGNSLNGWIFLLWCCTWLVWFWRNKKRCNESSLSPAKILESACSLLAEFQDKHQVPVRQPPQQNIKWKPPTAIELKTNFDRVMFADSNEAGLEL